MTFLTLLHTAPGGPAPVVVRPIDGSGLRIISRKRRPPYKLKPEEIQRQQHMVQGYLDSLEPKAPAAPPQKAPEFTATLARAAADVQLVTIIRIAAAVQDRERAVEELRRRRRLALALLLALD